MQKKNYLIVDTQGCFLEQYDTVTAHSRKNTRQYILIHSVDY